MAVKTPSPKTRRSKVEVQEQFDHLRDALAMEKEERSAHEDAAALAREKQIRDMTQTLTAETVVQRLNATGLEISKALSELSSRLLEECRQLDLLKQAVALEQKELERLHGLDVTSASLAQLVEDYEIKKRDFETDMAEARARWIAEKEAAEKERSREQEDYAYRMTQERKLEDDEQAQTARLQERANKEKQEALEKNWFIRESALKEKEAELARLQKENAEFPTLLKKEAERAVAEATKVLQATHAQAFALAHKDIEADRRLAEMRIKSLDETVTRQAQEISGLTERLEEAKRQVQTIAVKAIESASGSAALSHINQIAMEQAKTRSQS